MISLIERVCFLRKIKVKKIQCFVITIMWVYLSVLFTIFMCFYIIVQSDFPYHKRFEEKSKNEENKK